MRPYKIPSLISGLILAINLISLFVGAMSFGQIVKASGEVPGIVLDYIIPNMDNIDMGNADTGDQNDNGNNDNLYSPVREKLDGDAEKNRGELNEIISINIISLGKVFELVVQQLFN